MGERVAGRKRREFIGVRSLAAVAATFTFAHYSAYPDSDQDIPVFPLPPLGTAWDATDMPPTRAMYLADDGSSSLVPSVDLLPQPYSDALEQATKAPIVKLAVGEKAVSMLIVEPSLLFVNGTNAATPDFDNGTFEGPPQSDTGKITLYISDGSIDPHKRYYINNVAMRYAVTHEAIHGLDNEWWQAVKDDKRTDDPVLNQKLDYLKEKCTPVSKLLYERVFREMHVATKITATDLSDLPTCSTDISNIGEMTVPVGADIGEDFMQCIDEGHALTDKLGLDYTLPGGHPYDDATELASSVLTIIAYDPSYVTRCFDQQHDEDTALLRSYIKAVLDVSFYKNPKLEELIRRNPHSSEAIDYLLSVDK